MADPVPPTLHPVQVQRSPNYRRIYTNLFRYRINANDLSIVLQILTDDPKDTLSSEQGVVKVVEEAEITMSHSQVKSLLLHLNKLYTAFEKEFGTIKSTGGPTDQAIDGMITAVRNLGFSSHLLD
jgi:hypothetical protein